MFVMGQQGSCNFLLFPQFCLCMGNSINVYIIEVIKEHKTVVRLYVYFYSFIIAVPLISDKL